MIKCQYWLIIIYQMIVNNASNYQVSLDIDASMWMIFRKILILNIITKKTKKRKAFDDDKFDERNTSAKQLACSSNKR